MSRRRSIDVPGLGHGSQPIPTASLHRGILASGGIVGKDQWGVLPADAGEQIALLFDNVEAVLVAAGGSMDDLVKLDISVRDLGVRTLLNYEWMRRFPIEASRPARKVTVEGLPGDQVVAAQVLAVLGVGDAATDR